MVALKESLSSLDPCKSIALMFSWRSVSCIPRFHKPLSSMTYVSFKANQKLKSSTLFGVTKIGQSAIKFISRDRRSKAERAAQNFTKSFHQIKFHYLHISHSHVFAAWIEHVKETCLRKQFTRNDRKHRITGLCCNISLHCLNLEATLVRMW